MATHSSILAGEFHGQRSLEDYSLQGCKESTPVFLSGESQGRGSLVDCRLWGCTESDTTEVT